MWPRKRLDISWNDIGAGRWACATRWNRAEVLAKLRADWNRGTNTPTSPNSPTMLPPLSVRSGLHLLLGQLDWPEGSEVLMSAMTIPDMARIVRHHGYIPVPVDLDLDTAAPSLESLQQAVTPSTRGLIVAHLLGSRIPLQEILEFAHGHQLDVLEDCAQAYVGDDWKGTSGCLASMFSFGTIKTATAVGGGLVNIRDDDLAAAVSSAQSQWPVQQRLPYTLRLARTALLKVLSYRPPFALLRLGCWLTRIDYDHLLNNSTRGFPGNQLLQHISQAPSAPLMHMLDRRITGFDHNRLKRRTMLGERLRDALGQHVPLLGHRGHDHTFWVFPVLARDPQALVAHLRKAGFDATRGESMEIVAVPDGRHETAANIRKAFDRIVYLPVYPEMPESAIDEMAVAVREIETELA